MGVTTVDVLQHLDGSLAGSVGMPERIHQCSPFNDMSLHGSPDSEGLSTYVLAFLALTMSEISRLSAMFGSGSMGSHARSGGRCIRADAVQGVSAVASTLLPGIVVVAVVVARLTDEGL